MSQSPTNIEKSPYAAVEQVDQDVPPPTTNTTSLKRKKWEKLGRYNIWVLILGTLVIFLSVAFLAFLWIVAMRQSSMTVLPRLWLTIVREAWMSRVVTICTLVIRVALAAQLCVFAAIMAALILERVGASNEDFPMLSMIRCANTGPQALIWNVFHTIAKGTQLGYSFFIVITILNALALQFMSTILLADFGTPLVVLDPYHDEIMWALNATQEQTNSIGAEFWKSSQESYPAFAEYKLNGSTGPNYVDTGVVYRGFLPFHNATTRENVQSYSGPMTVVDERIVCMKPNLTNPQFHIPLLSNDVLYSDFNLNDTHPDITQVGNKTNFECDMPHGWDAQDPNFWYSSICRLDSGYAYLKGGILPEVTERDKQISVWFVFNVSSPWTNSSDWESTVPNPEDTVILPLRLAESPEGPWAKYSHPNLTVDATVCVQNPRAEIYDVETTGTRNTHTLDNTLYWNVTSQKYDTAVARLMLDAIGPAEREEYGIDPKHVFTFEERGILELKPVKSWNESRTSIRVNESYVDLLHGSLIRDKPWNYNGTVNRTWITTPVADYLDSIHRNNLWIFQDTLHETNNPALAMQAVTHLVMQTAYYDWFPNFDLKSNGTFTITEKRYIPQMYKHFSVVMGLLALHFVLVIVALVLFITKTEVSLLGNAWQAVAQVYSNDTAAAVQHGVMATDYEVRRTVKSTGFHQSSIIIRRHGETGGLEAVTVKPRLNG
ncbi:hypothetical protein FB567DRAFT_593401 [Paraphoma chrysanthemicola]|uniref:Uncharacterized protein n=1 Tax=Paraphoma chrysanthemicola TaxID=798071 RepID=A0A8K0R2X0_9PLEO|nr:hypothetical protein FB567DRAFT_593401 [Paraphoma chrysanthemicola]